MSIKFALRAVAGLVVVGLFSGLSAAQQTTPSSSPEAPAQSQPQAPAQSQPSPSAQPSQSDKDKQGQSTSGSGKVAGTSSDRLFYTLPNFLTLQNSGKLPPLSAKDKFKVVALGTFDYVQYPWWGLLAGISQAQNSEPAFGQGWVGYAKRYGTTAGDSTVENFMVGAAFPSILRQDPRFYQSGQGGIPRRVGYSVSRIFVTRSDSGKTQFNYSEIFGAATAAAVSTYSYHPKSTFVRTPTNPHMFIGSDRTLTNSASVYATQVGLDAITIVVKEFWPDVHRKLSHKSGPDQASTGHSGA